MMFSLRGIFLGLGMHNASPLLPPSHPKSNPFYHPKCMQAQTIPRPVNQDSPLEKLSIFHRKNPDFLTGRGPCEEQ